jgi:hypothetical protein
VLAQVYARESYDDAYNSELEQRAQSTKKSKSKKKKAKKEKELSAKEQKAKEDKAQAARDLQDILANGTPCCCTNRAAAHGSW